MKRFVALFCALMLTLPLLASCGTQEDDKDKDSDGKTILKVAVLESAYGKKMWEDVAAAYEADHTDIKIELTAEKNLEDVIGSKMKSGDYPDVVHLATGREAGSLWAFLQCGPVCTKELDSPHNLGRNVGAGPKGGSGRNGSVYLPYGRLF